MSINYKKFHITRKIYTNYNNFTTNKLRALHKTIENDKKIIHYENQIPRVKESYKCSEDKKLQENIGLQNEMKNLLEYRSSFQVRLQEQDFNNYFYDDGHKRIINTYNNKKRKCNKIIQTQRELLPKPKKKKRKRFKKQKQKEINVVNQEELEKQKALEELQKAFGKLKLKK